MRRLHLARYRVIGALLLVLVLAAVALLAVGWFYANEIEDGALRIESSDPEYPIDVVSVRLEGPAASHQAATGQVVLRADEGEEDSHRQPGLYGLAWPGGYGQIGGILDQSGRKVTRELTLLEGELGDGERARVDSFAFPGDPLSAHGIAFEGVAFDGPLGKLSAWFIPGDGDPEEGAAKWAIFVHGKGADRRESLRILPTLRDGGLSTLVITYRNDEGAPADPSGRYGYGRTEWEDLEAAVRHAADRGAESVVLVGYSMGGGIVASFLRRSDLSSLVAGVVLDSPMLDLGAAVDLGAEQRDLPGFLTTVAKWVSGFRFGLDWRELNYLADPEVFQVPMLVFHGDADETVPVSLSRSLAEARPNLVRYVEFEGAGHVRSWNLDQKRYEREVQGFLRRVMND